MSYFAKIEDGIVTNVIAADQDFIDNNMEVGLSFCNMEC